MSQVILRRYRFKLKIKSKEILTKLSKFAGVYRLVYNLALIQRNYFYLQRKQSISFSKQCRELTLLRKEIDFVNKVHSQVIQQALKDLHRAFQNFFNGNADYPQLKKKSKHSSFRYVQGVKIYKNRIYLPKIGWLKFFKSRKIDGDVGEVTVLKEADGWYISILVKKKVNIPEIPKDFIGIDVGIKKLAYCSNGWIFENHKSLKKYENKLKRAQRKLSRMKKNSKRRKRQKRKIAKIYLKIKRIRLDYLHKSSTIIAKNHSVVVEDLKIKNMSKTARGTLENPGKNVKVKSALNRSILDTGWGMFYNMLEYKCRENGNIFVKVNPKYTSLTCNNCGYTAKENRISQSKFICQKCGYTEEANLNAAKNILERYLSTVGHTGINARGVWAVA